MSRVFPESGSSSNNKKKRYLERYYNVHKYVFTKHSTDFVIYSIFILLFSVEWKFEIS